MIVDKNYAAVTAIANRSVILVKGRVVFEGDSPTLSLAHYISQGGATGRTAAELDVFISTRPFVRSRLGHLEQGGFVIRRGEFLELAERSTRVLDAGEFYRRLMGRATRGG